MPTSEEEVKKKTKTKRNKKYNRPNYILWLTLIIIAVPAIILGIILLTAADKAGVPIVGERFNDELNPPITEAHISQLKDSIVFEGSEVNINLRSATLRINIDTPDEYSKEDVQGVVDATYDKLKEILDIETYFTNTETTKMYDLEINGYNFIPDKNTSDEDRANYIWIVTSKSGAGEAINNVMTSPINEELSDTVKNPIPPQKEADDGAVSDGEGE